MGEIFPPHNGSQRPGIDPIEAVLWNCGGCLSNLLYACWRLSFLLANWHLDLVTGILSKKSFQALQLYIQISLSSGVIFRDKLRTLIWFLNYIRWYETTSLKVFSRLRLYYERCSFLNQWWKTKSKSSVCSSRSIKCKQSNDTKQVETKSSWKDKPENKPIATTHLVLCREIYSGFRQLIFGWLILQFPQS